MNFTLERIIHPDIEPLTLAQVKTHLRLEDSDTAHDDLLEDILIPNAREWVEDETGQALIDQTWRLNVGDFVASPFANIDSDTVRGAYWGPWSLLNDSLYLRKTPIIALTKFAALDSDGVEDPLDVDSYQLRDEKSKWPRVVALTGGWTAGPLRIEFRAGYADRIGSPTEGAEKVPARFKSAMLLHIEAHFDRDSQMMSKLLEAAGNLLLRLDARIPIA